MASESPPHPGRAPVWVREGSVLVYDARTRYSCGCAVCSQSTTSADDSPMRVAAFDLDHTLIAPRSQARQALDEHDWRFFNDSVRARLASLHAQGHVLAIFTNQGGVGPSAHSARARAFARKVERVVEQLGLPAVVLAALDYDACRKPCVGMWTLFCDRVMQKRPIDISASIFVGDAAGRPHAWRVGAAADHSDADLKFALNLGLAFRTPEDFFLSVPFPLPAPSFDPRALACLPPPSFCRLDDPEVVLLCGPPCSGKSFFAARVLAPMGYAVLSGPAASVPDRVNAMLATGSSVAVDARLNTRSARAPLVRAVQSAGGRIRCAVLDTPCDVCDHLCALRVLVHGGRSMAHDAWQRHARTWQEPSADEGFAAVVSVPFAPLLVSPEERETFFRFMF